MLSAPVDPRTAFDSANESALVQKKLSLDAMRKSVSGGPSEEKKLRDACEGFESVFLQKMWEQMRKNVQKEGYLHSKDEEAYQSMFDVELAKKMASAGGIGLADMLYEQLGQKLHNASKTTGSGLTRTPLPIEPARAATPEPEVAQTTALQSVPEDLYSAVPEVPAEPAVNPLTVALEEIAASRDPALDPANATYPMFDLQTGVPLNPVAGKMKEDSLPKTELPIPVLPERVSAPGKVKPSNALGPVRSSRRSRRSVAVKNLEAASGGNQGQTAQFPRNTNGNAVSNVNGNVARTEAVPGNARAVTEAGENILRGVSIEEFDSPVSDGMETARTPETVQAAPGAIPASTTGDPAGGNGWPVRGEVVSSYGRQADDTWNTGVTLAALPSASVTAPVAGTVAFVGEKNGIGQMVIAHENGLTSHYANVVPGLAPGDLVESGVEFARIAAGEGFSAVGIAGDLSRMHFEVRRGELAINPEILLA